MKTWGFSLLLGLATLVVATPNLSADEKKGEEGFMPLQDGDKPAEGWEKGVTVENGYLIGGGRYKARKYRNFIIRFDFRLEPGANSGIGIRASESGDPAFHGMEIQVLEDTHPKYANLQAWQYHGSIYGVVPAKRGHLKPVGEWNTQEIVVKENHIKVTLNGVVIIDADIKEAAKDGTIDKREHPGLFNETGYVTICGHGGGVDFRNLRIKDLDAK
jgi:hypothetical protein